MPYRTLDDVATADAAFEAWGATLEELFRSAADATMQVMVEDLNTLAPRERRTLSVEREALDLLLFSFVQELVYFKDAESLLLRVESLHIDEREGLFTATAEARGDRIDPGRHALLLDVKAVTLHRLLVERTQAGWRATVVLDI